MMATEKKPTPELIVAAARALAAVCDGAHEEDGRGYNGLDTNIMRQLAAQTSHSPKQLRLMWNILRKYGKQLAARGFDWNAMVPPPLPAPAVAKDGRPVAKYDFVSTPYGIRLGVVFPYDPAMVAIVKAMRTGAASGPWWEPMRKAWLFPTSRMAEVLKKLGETHEPEFSEQIRQGLLDEIERRKAKGEWDKAPAKAPQAAQAPAQGDASAAVDSDIKIPTKLPLRGFQKAGVAYADAKGGRVLIADEMGLGKTVQALGYLALHPEALPALVVCPSGLRVNWARETARFTGYEALVLSSKTGLKGLKKLGVDAELAPRAGFKGVTIVNYDLFEAETPSTWVKALLAGDEYGVPFLIQGGQYSLRAIDKALAKKLEADVRAKLAHVRAQIVAQGEKANRRKFVKAAVNGVSLEQFAGAGQWKTLIFDEMHYLKDDKSQRTMAAFELQKNAEHVIGLTGTPVKNRPLEVWSQTRVIKPDLFPNKLRFAQRYCAAHQTRFGWDMSGSSNLVELDQVLRGSIMVRREKSQVVKDLPPKTRITVPIVCKNGLKEYEAEAGDIVADLRRIKEERRAWKAATEKLSEKERKEYVAKHAAQAAKAAGLTGYALGQIEKAKQAATKAKLDDCMEFIENARVQQGKIIVFANHIETIEEICARLRKDGVKADMIYGGVPQARRVEIKDAFQEGDLEVLVCGIRAAAEGLTLTASHTVIFVEFDWNPATHDQAEARVDRIGQTVPPTMYYLVAAGTIEEQLVGMIDGKREVVNSAIGEGHRTLSEDGILDALLEMVAA